MQKAIKLAAIFGVALGMLDLPTAAKAQAQPDWDGYANCYLSCAAAFPGREADCTLSCKKQFGIDSEDDGGNRGGSDGRGELGGTYPGRNCYGSTNPGFCYPE